MKEFSSASRFSLNHHSNRIKNLFFVRIYFPSWFFLIDFHGIKYPWKKIEFYGDI